MSAGLKSLLLAQAGDDRIREALPFAFVGALVHLVFGLGFMLVLSLFWPRLPSGLGFLVLYDVFFLLCALAGRAHRPREVELEPLTFSTVLSTWAGEGRITQSLNLLAGFFFLLPYVALEALLGCFPPLWVVRDKNVQRILIALAKLRGGVPVPLFRYLMGNPSALSLSSAIETARYVDAITVIGEGSAQVIVPGPGLAKLAKALSLPPPEAPARVTSEPLDAFATWLVAHEVPAEYLSAYREGAKKILASAKSIPLTASDLERALESEASLGAPQKRVDNLRRVGESLLRFQSEQRPAKVAPPADVSLPINSVLTHRRRITDPDEGLTRVLVTLLLVVGVGWGGWFIYRRAFLGAQDATVERLTDEQVTLLFHRYPRGDRKDVNLEITSPILKGPVRYDWAYLAEHDDRPETTADEPPPLGVELTVRLDAQLQENIFDPSMKDFLMRARLRWAGHRQDLGRFNVRGQYREMPVETPTP